MSFETPGPVEEQLASAISPIEEIIAACAAGEMYILVDHEDREMRMPLRSTSWRCTGAG